MKSVVASDEWHVQPRGNRRVCVHRGTLPPLPSSARSAAVTSRIASEKRAAVRKLGELEVLSALPRGWRRVCRPPPSPEQRRQQRLPSFVGRQPTLWWDRERAVTRRFEERRDGFVSVVRRHDGSYKLSSVMLSPALWTQRWTGRKTQEWIGKGQARMTSIGGRSC